MLLHHSNDVGESVKAVRKTIKKNHKFFYFLVAEEYQCKEIKYLHV